MSMDMTGHLWVGGLKRQPPAATLALAIVSDADIKMGDNSFP